MIEAYTLLGCLPPTYEPRATGHVPEMITLMQRLIDTGHAYAADGDVYFDVRSWPAYGELSGQKVDEMQPAGDSVGDDRKRDPRDFALWKSAKPGEPFWPTPWGAGPARLAPGVLGHGHQVPRRRRSTSTAAGSDLVFPHHENELAQSTRGRRRVRPLLDAQRRCSPWPARRCRSQSATRLLVSEIVKQWRPAELRYYLGSAHYRSADGVLAGGAGEAGRRLPADRELRRARRAHVGADPQPRPLPPEFVAAMDDDLGVPQALALIHTAVRDGNIALGSAGCDDGR